MICWASFFVLVSLFWVLLCNEKTYSDRLLMSVLFHESDWPEYRHMARAVPYRDHLWSRVFFRDPNRLYDKELIDLVEAKS